MLRRILALTLLSIILMVNGASIQEQQDTRSASEIIEKENVGISSSDFKSSSADTKTKKTDINAKDSGLIEPNECQLSDALRKEISDYRGIVHQIIEYVVTGPFKGKTFDMLSELTDTFGSRMTGSKSLENSIDWMLAKFREQKLENVHTEPVVAPHWVRNNESLAMLEPRLEKLSLLGLGSSIATPVEGITAEVVVVQSFDELDMKRERVKNKIVVFNPPWVDYGTTVQYRGHGASRAAKHGALATLIRSVAPFSINSPHTGWQRYDDPSNKIPTACITLEDAQMLQRFQDRGERIVVKLTMGAENLPNVTTRNSIAEVMGYEKPDEVVVVSGHLDSWDVGVGAMDDGGGVMISWSATAILKRMGLRPRRTLRTVLFTAEEPGLYGGKEYFQKHSMDAEKYQLILESDIGTFNPKGMSFTATNETQCILKEILNLLEIINTTQISTPMKGGPDIHFWEKFGVPTGSVMNEGDKYFWFHHTEGDTMEVEDSSVLDKCAALWTAVSFVVADLSIGLPKGQAL